VHLSLLSLELRFQPHNKTFHLPSRSSTDVMVVVLRPLLPVAAERPTQLAKEEWTIRCAFGEFGLETIVDLFSSWLLFSVSLDGTGCERRSGSGLVF
jgi:hypothetical protein